MFYDDMTLEEFVEKLKSTASPVPAGASAAAANGLIGLGLLIQSLRILERKNRMGIEDELVPLKKELNNLEDKMKELIAEDVRMFRANQKEDFQDQKLLREVVWVPFRIASSAQQGLEIQKQLKPHVDRFMAPDLEAAGYILEACLNSAMGIVEANLEYFNFTDAFIEDIGYQIEKM